MGARTDKQEKQEMKTINVNAAKVEIEPFQDERVSVDLTMSDFDYYSILAVFEYEDIVREVGANELLEAMDIEDIVVYLKDLGIKTVWEE